MIGTSLPEYLFIRGCIYLLHSIAPISLLYSAWLTLQVALPSHYVWRAPKTLEAWLVAETVFFLAFYLPYRCYLQHPAIHPGPMSRAARRELFERCLGSIADQEKYLSRWHLNAAREHIRWENVKEFVRWAFFDTGEVRIEDEIEVNGFVKATEKLLGRKIPPGRGSAKSLRLTLDQVDYLHRSLWWYFCIFVVDSIMFCRMLHHGFHFHRTSLRQFFTLFPLRPLGLLGSYRSPAKHLTYWHRVHRSQSRLPILFIHGIGVGLYPYTNFLRDLGEALGADRNDYDVGIIALEIMPISSPITHASLGKDAMINEILNIVRSHGWDHFVLVSHSYGSVVATTLLKSPLAAANIESVVFVDPTSFLLHLPDVAYNFTARKPVRANEYQLWYFGSKDLGVAHAMGRRFFWRENILWMEDLQCKRSGDDGRNVTVFLSGRDLIVDVDTVRKYLMAHLTDDLAETEIGGTNVEMSRVTEITDQERGRSWMGSGLEVVWFGDLDHGQVFDRETDWKHIIKAVAQYSANS